MKRARTRDSLEGVARAAPARPARWTKGARPRPIDEPLGAVPPNRLAWAAVACSPPEAYGIFRPEASELLGKTNFQVGLCHLFDCSYALCLSSLSWHS